MTANELADALEQAKSISEVARLVKEETIPMLRRLNAENEALKKTVDSLFDGLNSSLLLNKAQAERNEK